MFRIVYTGFLQGFDLWIDIFSAFILAIIASFAFRYYKLGKKKNYLYLSSSFMLISAAFLFKALTNFTIYYIKPMQANFGFVTLTYHTLQTSSILFFVGFLLYRLLSLLGFYVLYSIYEKNQSLSNVIMIIYFIVISTYFSDYQYHIYHLTSLMMISFIAWRFHVNYRENRNDATKLLSYSFAFLGASQIFSLFFKYGYFVYVLSETIQMAGFMILLLTFIKVLRDAKKKK
jgi:hypothetical protein